MAAATNKKEIGLLIVVVLKGKPQCDRFRELLEDWADECSEWCLS